jgi:hypothetical protein
MGLAKVNWLFGEILKIRIIILELLNPFCKGDSVIFPELYDDWN